MKISIITVNLNNCCGLKRTVDSVLRQTVQPFEFIVVDGSSTDGSAEYLASVVGVSDFVSEKDSGIYDAMNKGIRRAKGDYVLFLNSGDTLSSREVLSVLSDLSMESDVIHGLSRLVFPGGGSHIFGAKRLMPGMSLFHAMIFTHQVALFRRTLFDRFGLYDTSFRIVADYDFILKLFLAGMVFRHIDILVSDYPIGGISNLNEMLRLREHRAVRFRHYTFLVWLFYTILYFPQEIVYYKKALCVLLFGRDIVMFSRKGC
jgi:glycosyltransferase involved in cell wall biosynthesis